MSEITDTYYNMGSRSAWTQILHACIKALGYDGTTQITWMVEREAAIFALRRLCKAHGDNEWEDHAHLEDIIEKHLARHLK